MDIDCTSAMSALKLSNSIEYPKISLNDEADIDLKKISLWEQFAKKLELSAEIIYQFEEKMNNFNKLSDDDLRYLLKFRFFGVWICLMSPRTDANSITFEDGTCFSITELELLYDHDLVNNWIKYILSLKSYQLTDVELELFAGVVFYSQRNCVTDVETVKKVQSYLIEDLNNKITSRIASASIKPPAFEISEQLSELDALLLKHPASLKWLKMNWYKVRIPEVVVQMNEIPHLIKMPTNLEDLSSSPEAIESQKIWLWNKISEEATLSIHFLKNNLYVYAGFRESTEKFCFFTQGFFELWFITMSVKACDSAIVLGVTAFSRQQLELIYDSDFVNDLIQLSLSLKLLSNREIMWVIGAVLFTQRPGLTNVEAVKKLQDEAFENFANERKKKYANANDTPPTFELRQKVLEINQLGLRHSYFLNWVKKNSTKLQLSSLFCVILNISKDETI